MAPFTISTHRPLPYRGCLPQETLFIQSKMTPELSSSKPEAHEDLPLILDLRSSIMKLKLHVWQVMRRVADCCMSATELISSKVFFFIFVAKNMTMMGALKKSSVEALERPGWEDSQSKEPEMKVVIEFDDDRRESSIIDWDEEEDDETGLSEWESDEETDENDEENKEEPEDVDSDWSDDDEGDSETSAESLELWESFLNSGDPYNPLSFCSSTGFRANASQNQLTNPPNQTQPDPETLPEESRPEPKEGKKVCFSDQVTVRPLVAWRFASRAARDGSCWLQMARDRERFRRRVESMETVLAPCLSAEHRAGVWERLQSRTPA